MRSGLNIVFNASVPNKFEAPQLTNQAEDICIDA